MDLQSFTEQRTAVYNLQEQLIKHMLSRLITCSAKKTNPVGARQIPG